MFKKVFGYIKTDQQAQPKKSAPEGRVNSAITHKMTYQGEIIFYSMKGKSTAKKPKRKPQRRSLTLKQEKFCQEYMETGNMTEAYKRSYNTSRMKPETINRAAFTLFHKSKINARIEQLREKLKKTFDIPREKVLYVLEAIHNAKITEYVEFDGNTVRFKPFDKLTDQQTRAIESIKQNEKGEIELKLHGKSWTTDRIMKMLGYEAPKKIDHSTGGEKIEGNTVIILPSNTRDE
jgi:phage terminase small subunit